jgi:hypothetical protein
VIRFAGLLLLGALLLPGVARPATWTGEFLFGGALNADSGLRITQTGYPDLDFDASWETRAFEQPVYWALRFGREGERHGWAVELHHHKIYLTNGPPEVEAFSISHGLNYITTQYRWLQGRWSLLGLGGVTAAHRENTVRGLAIPETGGIFDGGYELTGPVLGVGAGAVLPVVGVLELALEVRLVQSWISVDVADGRAETGNFALHLLFGPRLAWSR